MTKSSIKISPSVWYAIGLNVFVLLALLLISLFGNSNEKIIETFSLIWWGSFGWICGRMSNEM